MKPDVTIADIAEALGWIRDGRDLISPDGKLLNIIPDYIHDLNLVHDLEGMLTDAEWGNYIMLLHDIIPMIYDEDDDWKYLRLFMSATAQQKCNAIYPIFEARKARGG